MSVEVIVEPKTLYHTHIFEGEEVVRGDQDGQAWVATFASQAAAKNFITWSVTHSKSWKGLRPVTARKDSEQERLRSTEPTRPPPGVWLR